MISDADIQHMIDTKTKPLGALGQLEELAWQICRVQNTLQPALEQAHMLVFAADHGLADAGVSAYPKEVTAQMVMNFVQGGAAINVFCRQHGLTLKVIDAGVAFEFEPGLGIIDRKIGHGTRNAQHEAAMSEQQLLQCFEHGRSMVSDINSRGCNIIGFGEMGIGNTSSAALITHYLLNIPLEQCIGRGTGLDDQGMQQKHAVLQAVVEGRGQLSQPEQILQQVGGFEIAMMTQAMIEAAAAGMLVMVDGFIASAAALCACSMKPETRFNLIFCHRSEEAGHTAILEHLNAKPLLDLGMRLGEGSGCALAFPLIQSAVRFVNEMASFESAGISDKSSD